MQKIIVPMKGRMMHSLAGELTFQPYGKDETEVINSISRAELNIALMNAAEKHGVRDRVQRALHRLRHAQRCCASCAMRKAARRRSKSRSGDCD